jgi:beta-N-acetylhexosaminidase
VDVEGGTVNRLNEALAPIASAQAVAAAMKEVRHARRPTLSRNSRKDGARSIRSGSAREHGELIARAVSAFGFNASLAPVLDLALPESAEVLGSRPPATDPAAVIDYARGFLQGLASRSVAGCGKHFPGLGGGTLDSHLETPAISRAWDAIWQDDLEPYCALRDELPMVMINHASYPQTPGGERPASVSSYWIGEILRKRIGYRGMVLSDDLEMGGILKFMTIGEAAIEAIRAGSDLIEICHRAEAILEAFEALLAEGERSAAFRELLLKRAQEAQLKRARTFSDAIRPALGERQFLALRERILRFNDALASTQAAQGGTA